MKLANAVERFFDWLAAPTSVSFMQDGADTMSNLGFISLVAILVTMIVIVSVPKVRKVFF